ncbi:rab protein geranylgeranyltransferase component A [Apiospora saccharicola]|uniref:Rab proteins geranylgeranyltransferase n=1 Tax=Apiospora saccharicola TaxID=335842 RepID=A0ABR1V9Q4_9PEZI
MESLGDEPWDVVIVGTGLQQSLLALALSRSKKRVLHTDPNDYYGQHEAALTLQDAERFAAKYAAASSGEGDEKKQSVLRNATVWKPDDAEAQGLKFPRAYSLALAPQIIHTKSKLLSSLVSSRAYRQVEFLAVGSFYVYEPAKDGSDPKLSRIPSSREDVFSSQSIPARSKRSLMKFLKFVLEFDSDDQKPLWEDHADAPLTDFLTAQFKLEDGLKRYVVALTMALDGKASVRPGLAAINRHLTSLGTFGPGFCAVYPKWGGLSEVAQVACRAGAVGGGIYMLDTGATPKSSDENEKASLGLSNDITVQANSIVSGQETTTGDQAISRLVAVVKSPLNSLFQVLVEGAPTPTVAVVALQSTPSPIYALVHSSDTGECPVGQCVVYLTTMTTNGSKNELEQALTMLVKAVEGEESTSPCLYQLYYEQAIGDGKPTTEKLGATSALSFPPLSATLAFEDSDLEAVKTAWSLVMGDECDEETYLVFEDREGADAEDDV